MNQRRGSLLLNKVLIYLISYHIIEQPKEKENYNIAAPLVDKLVIK